MMGTRQIMYFLPCLFPSKRSLLSHVRLVPSTSVGNVNYFLSRLSFLVSEEFGTV